MKTILRYEPCADGNPVKHLGNKLEVYGDELTVMSDEGQVLVTVDLRDEYRLCKVVEIDVEDTSGSAEGL